MRVLFLKAVDRHDQATGDLFQQMISHVGYVDENGGSRRSHVQRHLVAQDEVSATPAAIALDAVDIQAPAVIEAWMSEGKFARLQEKVDTLNKNAYKITNKAEAQPLTKSFRIPFLRAA
jgi:hypothetical protein